MDTTPEHVEVAQRILKEMEEETSSAPPPVARTKSSNSVVSQTSSICSIGGVHHEVLSQDLAVNDALLQLQLLLTLYVSMILKVTWPKDLSCQNELIRLGFPTSRVASLSTLSGGDVEDGIGNVLSYISFLTEKRSDVTDSICTVILRVRASALELEQEEDSNTKKKKKNADFTTELGVQVECFLFDILVKLLSNTALVSTPTSSVSKLVEITFNHFVANHSSKDSYKFSTDAVGCLSLFALEPVLNCFIERMNKVYFKASALEYIPYMRVCSQKINFSLNTDSSKIATKTFLAALIKLLNTTNCPELIEETFVCISSLLNKLVLEIPPPEPEQDSVTLKRKASQENKRTEIDDKFDLSDHLETIFTIALNYCTKKKYITLSLTAMESIVGWEGNSDLYFSALDLQHDRLVAEIMKRVQDNSTRISGLDHLQRYLKCLPIHASIERGQTHAKRLGNLEDVLFPVNAIPRAQEIALISSVMVELGKRQFNTIFQSLVRHGCSDKARSAQRVICLNALAALGEFVYGDENNFMVAETREIFEETFSSLPVQYSGRENPSDEVAEALACFPYLAEHSKELLTNCVDNAFGFDARLVDAGRDSLIRFCQLGALHAEKAIMVVVETPNLRLISTQLHAKHRQDTLQILSAISTLDLVLSAALEKGFHSEELIAEAGSALLLASTYPDKTVKDYSGNVLEKLTKNHSNNPLYLQRAVDKLILGLLGGSASRESCGGAHVLQLRKEIPDSSFADPLQWWQNQCTLVCACGLSHSNKPTFVRALVQEFLTSQDLGLQQSALFAISQLDDLLDVVEKQLAFQSIHESEMPFHGLAIQLLACFHKNYTECEPLEQRILKIVSYWIKEWNTEESKARMRKWSQDILESAALLLKSYIENGELERLYEDANVARDQALFLIREWCRNRERVGKMSKVSQAFMTLLGSGRLHSVDAQTYALKMLSAFSGFKSHQSVGLQALLSQNLHELIGHYLETVLRSFDDERNQQLETTGTTITVVGGNRLSFIVHLVISVLNILEEETELKEELIPGPVKPQLCLLIALLFVHPVQDIRQYISQWVLTSRFIHLFPKGLSEDTAFYNVAHLSSKLGGIRKAVFISNSLSESMKEYNNDSINIEQIFVAASKTSQYLSDKQISHLIRLLEPWISNQYPFTGETARNKKIVSRLLRISCRLVPSEQLAWRVWRNQKLTVDINSTVETIVAFMVENFESVGENRASLLAFNQLCSTCEHQGTILPALVQNFPKLHWNLPPLDECNVMMSNGDSHVAADGNKEDHEDDGNVVQRRRRQSSQVTISRKEKQVKAVLDLITHAPFLLLSSSTSGDDLAVTLFYLFVEVGLENHVAKKALGAILEELPPSSDPMSIENGVVASFLSTLSELDRGRHAINALGVKACYSILYCVEEVKCARALDVLKSILGYFLLDDADSLYYTFLHEMILRLGVQLCQECNFLSKQDNYSSVLTNLEHLLRLLQYIVELVCRGEEEKEKQQLLDGCFSITKCLLGLQSVIHSNLLCKHRQIVIQIIEVAHVKTRPSDDQEMEKRLVEEMVLALATRQHCVSAAKILSRSLNLSMREIGHSTLVLVVTLLIALSSRKPSKKARELLSTVTKTSTSSQMFDFVLDFVELSERERTDEKHDEVMARFVLIFLRTDPLPTKKGLLELLTFLTNLLNHSSSSSVEDKQGEHHIGYCLAILSLLSHLLLHKEVVTLLSSASSSALDVDIREQVVEALGKAMVVWPHSLKGNLLKLMVRIPTASVETSQDAGEPELQFNFMQSKKDMRTIQKKKMQQGFSRCYSELAVLYSKAF